MEEDIKSVINDAVCCIVSTSAGYTDEQVSIVRNELNEQISLITNIEPSFLDGLRALVDPDINTPEWDARENIFVTLGKISEQFKIVDGKIVNLESLIKSVSETIVKEVSRLETRIKTVEEKVEGFDNRISANETTSAENTAAIKITSGRVDVLRNDTDKNTKMFMSFVEAMQGVCEVSNKCLEEYKASKNKTPVNPEAESQGDAMVL